MAFEVKFLILSDIFVIIISSSSSSSSIPVFISVSVVFYLETLSLT